MKKDLAKLEISADILDIIEKAIDGIEFGSITLIVQDSKVIQIERTEKLRLC